MKCVACRGGEPLLTDSEITEFQPQVPEWQIKEVDGIKRLERVFKLKNFIEAIAFTNRIGICPRYERPGLPSVAIVAFWCTGRLIVKEGAEMIC